MIGHSCSVVDVYNATYHTPNVFGPFEYAVNYFILYGSRSVLVVVRIIHFLASAYCVAFNNAFVLYFPHCLSALSVFVVMCILKQE